MTSEYLGSRNRHWRIQEHLRRFREPSLADAVAQEIEQFLCSLHGEGGNDDVSPAFEGLGYGFKELVDGWTQWLMQPVSICGFHHDIFGMGRRRGAAQQQAARITQVAGKQHAGRTALFRKLQKNAGRAENMAGVEESRAHTRGYFEDLGVSRGSSEIVETVQRVEGRIERAFRAVFRISVTASAPAATRVFLQQIGRIQHDQSRQLARGGCRDDLPSKPPLGQQRQTSAMIQMRMGQQHIIDAGGIKAERLRRFPHPTRDYLDIARSRSRSACRRIQPNDRSR